jgi:hypothetical protein
MFRLVLPDEARVYSGYLRDLMHDPDMLALLAASPEARRRLRRLWRMLTADPLPAVMRESRRARGPARPDSDAAETAPRQPRAAHPCVPHPSLPAAQDRASWTRAKAARAAPPPVAKSPALAERFASAGKPARMTFRRMRRGPDWPPWDVANGWRDFASKSTPNSLRYQHI